MNESTAGRARQSEQGHPMNTDQSKRPSETPSADARDAERWRHVRDWSSRRWSKFDQLSAEEAEEKIDAAIAAQQRQGGES